MKITNDVGSKVVKFGESSLSYVYCYVVSMVFHHQLMSW